MELGYSRFTMRKVATAAGISLGNLNYHFPRKDDLLKALLETIFAEGLEEAQYAAVLRDRIAFLKARPATAEKGAELEARWKAVVDESDAAVLPVFKDVIQKDGLTRRVADRAARRPRVPCQDP